MTEFILSIFISWAFVNTLKPLITWIKSGKISKDTIIRCGGMPSGHTALVVSMSTALFLETGFSILFFMGFILSTIVIYDALRVRTVIEEQSKVLNRLLKEKGETLALEERVGHTLAEVLVSLVISIIIPLVIYSTF